MTQLLIPVTFFTLAFFLVPFKLLDGFTLMPGDIGDARLNNYFLENIFQYVKGSSDSLWHLPFFYPYPYVIGFSDNLFGSSPIYILGRIVTGETDTSFQLWFFAGYAVNFTAAYYALRRLNTSVLASSFGALVFAFALPTSAHAGHAQLHYRFGLPLAIVFCMEFLNTKTWRFLLLAITWLVWQFYCGIYMGFFTLLLIVILGVFYFAFERIKEKKSFTAILRPFFISWVNQKRQSKILVVSAILVLLLLLVFLFYPYLQVTLMYGSKRSWHEIALMLPRPQSYFLSDASELLSTRELSIFSDIPRRHEHQMFIGYLPFIFVLMGMYAGYYIKRDVASFQIIATVIGAVALTMYLGQFSFWYLIYKLPLASAIRAMTRIDQALLFPVAFLTAISIDYLKEKLGPWLNLIMVFVVAILIFEFRMISMLTSSKESWRQRLSVLELSLPQDLTKDRVLFFAPKSGSFAADELDAMWISMLHGFKTMNGYSGVLPPGVEYNLDDQKDCTVISKRILEYLKFIKQSGNADEYHLMAARIVPIGFKHCDSISMSGL